MGKQTSTSYGPGFGSLLLLLFIALKLTHVIDWSWWWVLAPMWVPFCLVGALVMLANLAAGGRS